MRPFNLLRAVFYLVAVVILLELSWVMIAATGCVYLIIHQDVALGSCRDVSDRASIVFAEALAAVLALLVAARPPSPPSPPENNHEDKPR